MVKNSNFRVRLLELLYIKYLEHYIIRDVAVITSVIYFSFVTALLR